MTKSEVEKNLQTARIAEGIKKGKAGLEKSAWADKHIDSLLEGSDDTDRVSQINVDLDNRVIKLIRSESVKPTGKRKVERKPAPKKTVEIPQDPFFIISDYVDMALGEMDVDAEQIGEGDRKRIKKAVFELEESNATVHDLSEALVTIQPSVIREQALNPEFGRLQVDAYVNKLEKFIVGVVRDDEN